MKENSKTASIKTLANLLVISLLCILICIAIFSSGTYAWFSDGMQSSPSTFQTSGNCLLSVTVYKDGAVEAIAGVNSDEVLNCHGTYEVTLDLPKGSASGYLVIMTGSGEYYTDYLALSNTEDQTLSFTLNVQTEQSVTLRVCWGAYSNESHLHNGDTLTIA